MMMNVFRVFILCGINLCYQVTGLEFSLSKTSILLGSQGTLTFSCEVTETDVIEIVLVEIQREKTTVSGTVTMETLAVLGYEGTDKPALNRDITDDKDFVARGVLDKTTPENTYLALDMNIQKLTCSDARTYQCKFAYKSTSGSDVSAQRTASFSPYVRPQIMSFQGRRNGETVEGPSSTKQALFTVGDELDLTCTAGIGSVPTTKIRWRINLNSSVELYADYLPAPGTISEGWSMSDGQCGFTRTANLLYTTTVADAYRKSNLAFECYVSVTIETIGTIKTANVPRFYANVSTSTSQTTTVPTAGSNTLHTEARRMLYYVFVTSILTTVAMVIS